MSRLILVDRASDAPRPSPATRTVVLDPAWTPAPGGRADVRSIRPIVREIAGEVDVIHDALAALDAWAARAGLADAFTVDGLTWWFRARMLLRWDVLELVLWRHVLRRLLAGEPADRIRLPGHRTTLVAAAGAGAADRRPAIELIGGPSIAERLVRSARRRISRLRRRLAGPDRVHVERVGILERRLDDLARERGGIVTLAWPKAFQVVRDAGRERRLDPYLAGTLDVLAARGDRLVTIGLALDHRRDEDWALIEGDDRLLPERFLLDKFSPAATAALDAADVAARVADAAGVPCVVEGDDLGPALAQLIAGYTGRWLDRQRRLLRAADATLRSLQPDAVFTDREGSRAAWLAAAARHGIRSVAVQHGMIYPNNPEYFQGAHPARVRPDATCVFGKYERDLLVGAAGFQDAAVIVTGSPRPLDIAVGEIDPAARAAIRSELGIRGEDKLLLVSVAHNPLLGELLTYDALERVLGGPLPSVHIVIKLHPQDQEPPRHEAFLRDLAAAGGYDAPAISVVRNVDLYQLLRAADAHLGQYSTVLSDAVVTDTPNMMIVGHRHADALDYVAAGVATPVASVDHVRAFLAQPTRTDPVARSRFLAEHFRPGDAAERIAAVLRASAIPDSA